MAIAASWALTVSFALGAWLYQDSYGYALGRDVTAHVKGEPEALQHAFAVPADGLRATLATHDLRIVADLGAIVFAETCVVRGQRVPHLVVRSEAGPIAILILPEKQLLISVNMESDGFHAYVVGKGGRTVAVVAANELPQAAADEVLAALDWRF